MAATAAVSVSDVGCEENGYEDDEDEEGMGGETHLPRSQ